MSGLPRKLQLQGMPANGRTHQSLFSSLSFPFLETSFLMHFFCIFNLWFNVFLLCQLNESFKISKEEEIEHLKSLLRTVLPFLKQFNEEQKKEKEMEAKIQGNLF